MALTKQELKNLHNQIKQAKNIYDVLVACYRIIDDSSMPGYIQDYSRYREEGGGVAELGLLVEELAGCDISFERFREELAGKLTAQDARNQGIFLMFKLDHLLEEREQYPLFQEKRLISVHVLSESGPLNLEAGEYGFYLLPRKNLVGESSALRKCKLRFMNQTSGDNIFYKIKNYRIIRKIKEIPDIHARLYHEPFFAKVLEQEGAAFRIAVIPLANRPWYGVDWQKSAGEGFHYFEIHDEEQSIDAVNDAYVDALESLEEIGAEIAVFPEVAMNRETEKLVREHLIRKNLQKGGRSNLRLVFLGSWWDSCSNRCTLLSGSGTVLLRNDKKSPVELEYKGTRYQEKLKKRPEQYTLMDVEGLGRILYLICKDDLEDLQQVHMWHDYGVNVEVISCYSKSISYFEEEADLFSKKYGGISMLANCCEPRVNRKEVPADQRIGFLALPCTTSTPGKRTSSMLHEYTAKAACIKECRYCRCARIFTVRPHQIQEEGVKKGLMVEEQDQSLL